MRCETQWSAAIVRSVTNPTAEVRQFETAAGRGAQSYPPGSHVQVNVMIAGMGGELTAMSNRDFGIDRYVRLMDSSSRFCQSTLNSHSL